MIRISFEEGERHINWHGLCRALEQAHRRPRAEITDTFQYRGDDTLLLRSAWIDGMGIAVKLATIFPGNTARGMASIHGGLSLMSDHDGSPRAEVDFFLVTKWKTAGDSLYAATRLARPDSRRILIVGAGNVAGNLYEAYGAGFPTARFRVWNRNPDSARTFAGARPGVEVAEDLQQAVEWADIITCATMSTAPLIKGAWLRPGQHLDLVGAYRLDMREADDEIFRRGRVFVDSFDSTIGHIGEVMAPMDTGALTRGDIVASYYEAGDFARHSDSEITVFKNGGGAHLDLMVADYILRAFQTANGGG